MQKSQSSKLSRDTEVAYRPTFTREAAASHTSVWRIVDRAKARAWLQEHPDRDYTGTGRNLVLFPEPGVLAPSVSHG